MERDLKNRLRKSTQMQYKELKRVKERKQKTVLKDIEERIRSSKKKIRETI